jgi:hypothetical protein
MKLHRTIITAVAFIASLCASATGSASILIQNAGTSWGGVAGINQPLAKVVIGASDVAIAGLGVFGQAQSAGNVKWVIFDSLAPSTPLYLSAVQAVAARAGQFATQAMWYDSPSLSLTLQAGRTYAMGLITDVIGANGFLWGVEWTTQLMTGGGASVDGNGVALPFVSSVGSIGSPALDTPSLAAIDGTSFYRTSLRLYEATAPIPEPAEWTMLAAGLFVISFIARRRRQMHR